MIKNACTLSKHPYILWKSVTRQWFLFPWLDYMKKSVNDPGFLRKSITRIKTPESSQLLSTRTVLLHKSVKKSAENIFDKMTPLLSQLLILVTVIVRWLCLGWCSAWFEIFQIHVSLGVISLGSSNQKPFSILYRATCTHTIGYTVHLLQNEKNWSAILFTVVRLLTFEGVNVITGHNITSAAWHRFNLFGKEARIWRDGAGVGGLTQIVWHFVLNFGSYLQSMHILNNKMTAAQLSHQACSVAWP